MATNELQIQVSATLDIQRSTQQLQADLNRIARGTQLNVRNVRALGGATSGAISRTSQDVAVANRQITQLDQNIGRANRSARSFTSEITRSAAKFMQWALLANLIYEPFRALEQGVKVLYEIDKQLTEIRKVTGDTAGEMKILAENAALVGAELGRTAQEYLQATEAFAKAGLDEQSEQMAKLALLMSNVGDIPIEQSFKTLIATTKGMNMQWEESVNIIDKLKQRQLLKEQAERLGMLLEL
jgi:hypothetical protein